VELSEHNNRITHPKAIKGQKVIEFMAPSSNSIKEEAYIFHVNGSFNKCDKKMREVSQRARKEKL